MTVYAHSTKDKSKADWEPLADHLQLVITFCCQFAGAFGAAAFGQAIAALHDIGKLAEEFQRYLEGAGDSRDHSTAGAVLALDRYGPQLGKIIAFCAAGHHAGLTNGAGYGGSPRPLDKRVGKDAPPPPPLPDELAALLPDRAALAAEWVRFNQSPFSRAFFIRMLFSCLCDADFLATEKFYARVEKRQVERGSAFQLPALLPLLGAHMARLQTKANRETRPEVQAVNGLRARVLATMRDRAGDAPGLFSLSVPTGGGKTLSSLSFAMQHAAAHGKRRIIYVIPYTSIVEQTADVFREFLPDDAILEHHSGYDPGAKTENVSDDEGKSGEHKMRLAAQNWDRPVVVTTAVQFFESLFGNRTQRCRKLHNIANSVIILDEAQTLPLPFLKPCLAAIQELADNYGCSLVLCTATQPAVAVADGFEGGLRDVRQLAPNPQQLYAQLDRVQVIVEPTPIEDDALAARLAQPEQVLCIVDNRRYARALFDRLKEVHKDSARLLTADMCAAHRRVVLAEIKQRLDPKNPQPVHLIATSLIEAGVDVSFPKVFRAMAGLDQLAQAAGRCNRHGELGWRGGEMVVFQPPKVKGRGAPHEIAKAAELCQFILEDFPDSPLGQTALSAYFGDVYHGKELHGLLDGATVGDIVGVLKALRERNDDQTFPFAAIAEAFQIIDDHQVPVIIPYAPEVKDLLGPLWGGQLPGGVARKLQPYLVQIPRRERQELIDRKVLEVIRPKVFGDQFVVLREENRKIYGDATGLDRRRPDEIPPGELSF